MNGMIGSRAICHACWKKFKRVPKANITADKTERTCRYCGQKTDSGILINESEKKTPL